MVECQPSKLATRVRFPSPAQKFHILMEFLRTYGVFLGLFKNVQMQGRPRRSTKTYLNGTLQGVPTRATKQMDIFQQSPADIAQTVEHIHGKDGVNGSIPFVGSS